MSKTFFSQECQVLSNFQYYLNAHYHFKYKLSLEWSPKLGRILIFSRRFAWLMDQCPLFLSIAGMFTSVFGAFGIIYEVQNGILPSWDPITSIKIQLCLIATLIAIFTASGSYFILSHYKTDLCNGMNMLIKFFAKLESRADVRVSTVKGAETPRWENLENTICKNNYWIAILDKIYRINPPKDLLCLLLRFSFVFTHYLIPICFPIFLIFNFDPTIHAINHLNRFVPFIQPLTKFINSDFCFGLIFHSFRYFVSLLIVLEFFRILILVACIICFGSRIMNASLDLIRKRFCGKAHSGRGIQCLEMWFATNLRLRKILRIRFQNSLKSYCQVRIKSVVYINLYTM